MSFNISPYKTKIAVEINLEHKVSKIGINASNIQKKSM